MTTRPTNPTNPIAVREWDAAITSLAHAEALFNALNAIDLPGNPYLIDAFNAASELCAEMSDNLEDVQSRWTPEDVGI